MCLILLAHLLAAHIVSHFFVMFFWGESNRGDVYGYSALGIERITPQRGQINVETHCGASEIHGEYIVFSEPLPLSGV